MSQSTKSDRISESTIARMAGNIAAGMTQLHSTDPTYVARQSVKIARAIAAEVERTAPKQEPAP